MHDDHTLTPTKIRDWFTYDETDGVLRYAFARGMVSAGASAGYTDQHGYVRVRVSGFTYAAHRLVWAYCRGEWPAGSIDHRNGDKSDNRIDNLRVLSPQHNSQNRSKARSDSTSGLIGAQKYKDRWRARITVEGKKVELGTFVTAKQAHYAYVKAKKKLHPGWASNAQKLYLDPAKMRKE